MLGRGPFDQNQLVSRPSDLLMNQHFNELCENVQGQVIVFLWLSLHNQITKVKSLVEVNQAIKA